MSADPTTDLVVNAMGYGVMLATDGRDKLHAALRALGSDGTLTDALRGEAEQFCRTRSDLVEALNTANCAGAVYGGDE